MNTVGKTNEASRIAWVISALKQLPAGARLLDAGAGEQQFRQFCGHLHYVSHDFARYDGSGDGTGLHTGKWNHGALDIVSDITGIPEPDASFDAILCTEVLEHVPDPVRAVREFARLLRTGGQLVITAPFCSMTHMSPYYYSTGFSRHYYLAHLPMHGFEVVELTPNGNYFEFLAQELRRVPWMARRYAGGGPSAVLARILARPLLPLLASFSERDKQSAEMMAFGYHVRAVRGSRWP